MEPTVTGTAPAWRRRTEGEHRWPAAVAVAVVIALHLALPEALAIRPQWLLPAVEGVLLVVLIALNPTRVNRESRVLRVIGLSLTFVLSVATGWSAVALVRLIVSGQSGTNATALLLNGAAVWVTNVLVFALWYWEVDRGGPAARALGRDPYPDFLFTGMTAGEYADPHWEPGFVDYLYTSFTNATAFSPTDTMPLSRGAKVAMLVQASISLATAALVVARAVNILN